MGLASIEHLSKTMNSRLSFDQLVGAGAVNRAARLAATLLQIARGLRHAGKGLARL
jgi:hypothetical protein